MDSKELVVIVASIGDLIVGGEVHKLNFLIEELLFVQSPGDNSVYKEINVH